MEVTPEMLSDQSAWSAVRQRFAEFFLADPERRDEAAFAALAEGDVFLRYHLQRWLMFLGPAAKTELARPTTDVCRLVSEIPRRVLALDPESLADSYCMPKKIAQLIAELVTNTDCLKDMVAPT